MSLSRVMAYSKVNTVTGVESADPHMLIQMLLEGAIEKINRAKFFLASEQLGKKGENISWAISIIGGLQTSLNMEQGGEISRNLSDLYEFSVRHLLEANIENSESKMNTVLEVLGNILEGWKGIREEAVKLSASHEPTP